MVYLFLFSDFSPNQDVIQDNEFKYFVFDEIPKCHVLQDGGDV